MRQTESLQLVVLYWDWNCIGIADLGTFIVLVLVTKCLYCSSVRLFSYWRIYAAAALVCAFPFLAHVTNIFSMAEFQPKVS